MISSNDAFRNKLLEDNKAEEDAKNKKRLIQAKKKEKYRLRQRAINKANNNNNTAVVDDKDDELGGDVINIASLGYRDRVLERKKGSMGMWPPAAVYTMPFGYRSHIRLLFIPTVIVSTLPLLRSRMQQWVHTTLFHSWFSPYWGNYPEESSHSVESSTFSNNGVTDERHSDGNALSR
ncbi:hypothetical protein FOL47_009559 [Perkinsus chesapeaki]|uniref:Uncharacterized protein n=1 Tax=Perkinsus chesapeaki TaxID=330153 RepID=A0A7J6L7H2_PERCH|nr:hypothetical protein FOL47_009559 [Perkinsus chesapeaki]